MFRRVTRSFSPPALWRAFSTDIEFNEAWKKAVSNVNPPKVPLSLMFPRPIPASAIPSKLALNFVLPHESDFQFTGNQVDMAIIPAKTGQMGVLPGHVPTITELHPGVVSLREGNEASKYFVAEFTEKLSSASSDLEKAEAQAGIELFDALDAAPTE